MGLFDLFKGKEEKVLKQNLEEKAEFSPLFTMEILFEEQPKVPGVDEIKEVLEEKFGDVDIVSGAEGLSSFAIKKYRAKFKEGSMPPQLLFMSITDFNGENITDIERSQLWNVPDGNKVLEKCNYIIIV